MYKINKFKVFWLLFLFFPGVIFASQSITDGFDFPAGTPNGTGYSNGSTPGGRDGWGWLEFNGTPYHPGEDWNRGSGYMDYGDPVYSIGNGRVIESGNYGGTWGKIILIEHILPNGTKIWSQYAHLKSIEVKKEQIVSKGYKIGEIGDGDGKSASHLHFEIRKKYRKADAWVGGWSKEKIREYYHEPTKYINENRQLLTPPKPVNLSLDDVEHNSVTLSWSKNTSEHFLSYKLYRSNTSPVDQSSTLVSEITDEDILTYEDEDVLPKSNYYYALFVCNTANKCTSSNEISIKTKHDPEDIGKIVYSSKKEAVFQIMLIDSSPDNIIKLRVSPYNDYDPKWSYDGKKILFSSLDPNQGETRQVFVMDASGQNEEVLTNAKYGAEQASWFPSQDKIVYRGNDTAGLGLYVKNISDESVQLLTSFHGTPGYPNFNPYNPSVSPDGLQIIFNASYKEGAKTQRGLFLINADGTGLLQLTKDKDSDPEISPDGKSVVFSSNRGTSSNLFWNIWLATEEGEGALVNLTGGGTGSSIDPSWSPDGKAIIYASRELSVSRKPEDVHFRDYEINILYLDTGQRTKLTDNSWDDISPDWFWDR